MRLRGEPDAIFTALAAARGISAPIARSFFSVCEP
jgi:hypothetical protein